MSSTNQNSNDMILDPNNLDWLDLHDNTHISFDSVMTIANTFSEVETADPVEYIKPRQVENIEFCVGAVAIYVVFLVFGLLSSGSK